MATSTYRTCDACLYFYIGRNAKNYCKRPPYNEYGGMPEKKLGDSCKEWTPRDGRVLKAIEEQEQRDLEAALRVEEAPALF